MPLSDTWLRANNGKRRDKGIEKTDRDGLSVRVTPTGKIIFQLRYRYNKKSARLDIGSYPRMSLKSARAESNRLRAELELGHDPRVLKKLERESIVNAKTVSDVFYHWHDSYCVKNKTSHHEIKRSFELHVLPRIGSLPLSGVSIQAWLSILEPMAVSRPAIAERILINTKQMLNWAIKRNLVDTNVLAHISPKADLQIKKKPVIRVLSSDEIKLIFWAINESRMTTKNGLFIKLCLFFGCRSGELRISKKDDFNFDKGIWTVPAENHKTGKLTGKPLLRPIIDDIKPVINAAFNLSNGSVYAFTNVDTTTCLTRSATGKLQYIIMQWLRRHHSYDMYHWSLHDLRRTARTNFSTLTEPHIAEIMLGHKLPGEWQVYDHHDYLEEQALAYQKWFNVLAGMGF